MRRLGLSIPLYNEEEGCVREVEALLAALEQAGIPHQLALVDNGSQDATGRLVDQLARRHDGVLAVHLSPNAGYGGGILAGLAALDTPWLGWHWGDGQVRPEIVVAACQRMARGDLQLVKARRMERHDGLQRLFISTAYNRLACPLLGVRTRDVNGCPKIFTRAALEQLAPRSTDWLLDLEVVWGAERAGMAIDQVQAAMHPRQGGVSKVRSDTVVEFLKGMARARLGRPPWAT